MFRYLNLFYFNYLLKLKINDSDKEQISNFKFFSYVKAKPQIHELYKQRVEY